MQPGVRDTSPNEPSRWLATWLGELAARFEQRPARELLDWALQNFSPRICLATSFGPQTIVLMHWIAQTRPETTIFYLDTGLLFAETMQLRDRLHERLGLRFTRVTPEQTVEQQPSNLVILPDEILGIDGGDRVLDKGQPPFQCLIVTCKKEETRLFRPMGVADPLRDLGERAESRRLQ